MDKKKQYQLQNLKSKLNNYEASLNELQKQRSNILLNTSNTSNISNISLDTTLNNILDSNLDHTLDNFITNKNDIESKIIQTKNNITSGKYELVSLTNKLKLLPEQLHQNISSEINIYNEELSNLDNTKSDTIQNHIQNIEDFKTKKTTLYDEISNLENQINEQNTIISDLQSNAHQSRKNILQTLHHKKQQKILLQQEINTVQSNSNIYQNTIDDLNTINNFLLQTKRDLIDYYYDTEDNTKNTKTNTNPELLKNIIQSINSFELLKSYNITFDTLDSQDNFNNFISKFDEIIFNNIARIQSITQKSDKAKNKTNIHIENIKKTQDTLYRNQKTHSYKDSYKIEKNKRIELQNKYIELQNLYNNYELEVIGKLQGEHNTNLLELDYHKARAEERLNIMKDRLQNEYQQNKNNLEDQIKSIQVNLAEHNNKFRYLNKQLVEINNNLSSLDKNKKELKNIENKINEIIQIIGTLKNDIKYLELEK